MSGNMRLNSEAVTGPIPLRLEVCAEHTADLRLAVFGVGAFDRAARSLGVLGWL